MDDAARPRGSDGCPARDVLDAFASCDPHARSAMREVRIHLETCESCGEIVAGIEADHMLLRDAALAVRDPVAVGVVATNGDRSATHPEIPGYDLLEEIERGGQGVVFRAVQRGTRRDVAIKVLLDGRLSTARQRHRFEREIEIVAALRHPGIVTLHDGGVADDGGDGLPWFAMEYVDGERLDRWVRREPRSLEEVLRVHAAIVDAVAAAHRHGVIHRDLKPGNILVDAEGSPRVLDFGLALPRGEGPHDPRSRERGFVGTLAYAAPEQLDSTLGALDAPTDVYALGVLLADLIVATRSPRQIETKAPSELGDRLNRKAGSGAPVSTTSRSAAAMIDPVALRRAGADRDLIAIACRATAMEKADRYDSASAFAEDLRRHTRGLPVAARGDSPLYLFGTLARRHRTLVTAIVAFIVLLVAATVTTSILLVQRDAQRTRAERNLAALGDALRAADPLASSTAAPSALQLVEAFEAQLDRRFPDDPEGDATVRQIIGGLALNLGDLDRAERAFRRALQRRHESEHPAPLGIASIEHDLARVEFYRGRFAEAELLYRAALSRRRDALGSDHADVATTLSHLASCRRRLGDIPEAESLFLEALAIRRASGNVETTAAAINNLGSLRREIGDNDGAIQLYRESLELLAAVTEADDWRVGHVMTNIGSVLIDADRFDEAERMLEDAESVLRDRLPADHPKRLVGTLERIRLLMRRGDEQGAESAMRELATLCPDGLPVHAEVLESADRLRQTALTQSDDSWIDWLPRRAQ